MPALRAEKQIHNSVIANSLNFVLKMLTQHLRHMNFNSGKEPVQSPLLINHLMAILW